MRFQDTSQKSNRKLSYVELKWFYALADPKDQHMFLLQLDDQTQRMFIIEQRIDQLEKKFDDFRKKQDSAKWYHANRFINTWAGFIIANTLLDPVKPLILETTKAAIPIIGTAAQNFLNYTAKIIMALRDSLGK